MYISEKYDEEMMEVSKRIQTITKFNLSNEPYASENFKIMNYGTGGKVKGHWDSVGNYSSK